MTIHPSGKLPPPAAWRWAVLIAISVAMTANYYVYDSIGPVADALQKMLGFSDTQLGALNAIYSAPNIVMVLIGGVLVDRWGARRTILTFTIVCAIGAIVTALSPLFPVMATGRLLFGLGAESMIVAVTVAIGQWFVGRQLGFAFGINLSLARAGSYAVDKSPTWAMPLYDGGWQPPLELAAGIMLAGVAVVAAYYVIDRVAATRFDLQLPRPSDKFNWADLWRFDRSYWYIVGLCVTFYAVILPFRSTFAIKYFQHTHGLSLQDASDMNAHVYFAAIIATPLFGLMVDKLGHRSAFMTLGSLCLFVVFPILAYTTLNLWVATVLLGIAFSLVPAVLWPAVPYLVTPERLGTAYGLMMMLQNVGLTTVNLGAGMLNDAYGGSAENPQGYLPMLGMFGLLSLFGFLFAEALRRRESGAHGHGLETIRA